MNKLTIEKSKFMHSRVIFGRICILAFIIVLFSIFDALVASYRKPTNHFDIITDRSIEIIGKIYGNATNMNDISFTTDSPNLTLIFEEKLFSGYWLGETMWRGKLKANSALLPGRYHIKIYFNDLSNIKLDDRAKIEELCTYTINVYSDAKTLRQSALSIIKRFTGISPWSIAIAFFPIVLISGGLIFIISGKIEVEMARQGFAEIYRVSKHDRGLEIFFGLGKTHGLQIGEKLNVFNESGDLVTKISVESIGNVNSSALIDIPKIKPGCIVARI